MKLFLHFCLKIYCLLLASFALFALFVAFDQFASFFEWLDGNETCDTVNDRIGENADNDCTCEAAYKKICGASYDVEFHEVDVSCSVKRKRNINDGANPVTKGKLQEDERWVSEWV